MPLWMKACIYLAIGIITSMVVVWGIEAHSRNCGEIQTSTQRRNLALLTGTIAVFWPGFYMVLIAWMFPILRRVIVKYVETGKL